MVEHRVTVFVNPQRKKAATEYLCHAVVCCRGIAILGSKNRLRLGYGIIDVALIEGYGTKHCEIEPTVDEPLAQRQLFCICSLGQSPYRFYHCTARQRWKPVHRVSGHVVTTASRELALAQFHLGTSGVGILGWQNFPFNSTSGRPQSAHQIAHRCTVNSRPVGHVTGNCLFQV